MDAPIVLVKVDGRLRELHKQLKKDCELEFVTTEDEIGHKTYQRSLSLLLVKAVYHVGGYDKIRHVMLHFSADLFLHGGRRYHAESGVFGRSKSVYA